MRYRPHAGLRADPTARQQGRTAVRTGRTLEAYLAATHDYYRARGAAVVAKLHPETAGPPNARRFVAPGAVDYMGVIGGGGVGIPVAFDAKNCAGKASYRLDTRPRAREVQRRQLQFLLDYRTAGGVAFLCVFDPDLGRAFLLGPAAMQETLDAGATPIRAATRGGLITSPHPTVPLATPAQLAAGAPPLDYLTAIRATDWLEDWRYC